MSITADREVYALESRSESLDVTSVGHFVREGESDLTEVGMGSLVDSVDGDEEATYGSLTETHDHKLNRMIGAVETEIRGEYTIDGKDDMLMVTGAMAETQAGGMVTAAGQSDDLIGISGMRLTLVGDLWIAGLFGMEEKIATGVADGILIEVSGLAFEREYLSSNYNGLFAYQNAAITHTTAATTFFPMFKTVRGLRNQLPGSGAPEGEGGEPSPAAAPPAAGGEGADAATGGTDGVVNAGAVDSGTGESAGRAAATAGEGAPPGGATGGATNTAQATGGAANTANTGLLNGAGTANAATNAAQPGVDLANVATPSTWHAAEKLAGMQKVGAVDGAKHVDGVSDAARVDGVQHADQGSAGSQMDEMLAAAESGGDPGYDTIPAHRGPQGQADTPPAGAQNAAGGGGLDGGDPLYDTIPAQQNPQVPDDTGYGNLGEPLYDTIPAQQRPQVADDAGDGRLGEAGYAEIPGEEIAPNQPAPDPSAPARPPPEADPNATYAVVQPRPRPKPQAEDPDIPPPLPSRPDFSAEEVASLGGDVQVSRYAGEEPPAPGRDALYKQSFGYKQSMEANGIEVEWRSGCWRPVLEEGAPPPTMGRTQYIGGEWRIIETGAEAADSAINPGALQNTGLNEFGGRDPGTYSRMRKLVGLAGDGTQGIVRHGDKGSSVAEFTAESRQAYAARVFRKPAEETITHSPEVQRALDRLQAAADAAARSDAGNEWWDEVHEVMKAADKKIAEMDADDDLAWIARMDDTASGIPDTAPKAAEGLQKAVVQATDPTQQAVFGVRNPAYQGSGQAMNLRHVENSLSGSDASHLLPKASQATEQVGAVEVMRASDSLDKMRPRANALAGDEAKTVLAGLRKKMGQLEDAKAAGGASQASGSDLALLQNVVAALEGAVPELRQSVGRLESGKGVLIGANAAEDAVSPLAKTTEAVEDIADGSLAQMFRQGDDAASSSSWQPSPSVVAAGEDGAQSPPVSPQVDSMGAKWGDSTDGATSASDGRPQTVILDQRTVVVQGEDGTTRVETVTSGSRYDNSDWLDELSNAAPPPGMAVGGGWKAGTQRPSRLQKLRSWFSSKAAQLRQWLSRSGSGAQSAGQASGADSATGLGRVDGEIASDLETAAVLDSVPGKAADQLGISPAAPPPSSLSGEDARQFQSSLEGANPVSPGKGDALESPGDAVKGIDNDLELQQTSTTFNVTFKAGDDAAGAGKAGDDAAGAGKAGSSAAGAGRAGQEAIDPTPYGKNWYSQYNKTLNMWRDAHFDAGARSMETVFEMRNWGLDEIQRRMTDYIRKSVDPNITDAKMGIRETDYYKGIDNVHRHPTVEIKKYLEEQYRLAMAAGDTKKAQAAAEGIRSMSGYMDSLADTMRQTRVETNFSDAANYDHVEVLKEFRNDSDYKHWKHWMETGELPPEVWNDTVAKLGRDMTADEVRDALAVFANMTNPMKMAEDALAEGGDARGMMHRFVNSFHTGAVAGDDAAAQNAYIYVRDLVDEVVEFVHMKQTGNPPPPIANTRPFSVFDQSHRTMLLAEFDMVEGSRVIDTLADDNWASGIIGSYYPDYGSGGARSELAADTAKVDAVTDAEAVVHGVAPDFPMVEVRAPETPKEPDIPPPSASRGAMDDSFAISKFDSVVDSGKVEDAAGPLQTTLPPGVRDPQTFASEFDKRITSIHERQRSAAADQSRRALGTVMDVRNKSLDEMQRRATNFIRTHIDPNVTDEAMGIGDSSHYRAATPSDRHPVTDIMNYLKAQHTEAADVNDVNKANAAAEAIRMMSEHATVAEEMLAQKHLDAAVIDKPPYDPSITLFFLEDMPGDHHYYRKFSDAGANIEDSPIYRRRLIGKGLDPDDPGVSSRVFTDMEMQEIDMETAAYARAYREGELALQRGEDVRSVMQRHASSTDVGDWQRYMTGAYDEAQDYYDKVVQAAYQMQRAESGLSSGDVPPPAYTRIFSEFSDADMATLRVEFDHVDSTMFRESNWDELGAFAGGRMVGEAAEAHEYMKTADLPQGIRDANPAFDKFYEHDKRFYSVFRSESQIDSKWKAGTSFDVWRWSYDTIYNRIMEFTRTYIDPNATAKSMNVRTPDEFFIGNQLAAGHSIVEIRDYFRVKYTDAVKAGDAATANKYAAGISMMAQYLEEAQKVLDRKMLELDDIPDPGYDLNLVVEALRNDPDFQAFAEYKKSGYIEPRLFKDDFAKAGGDANNIPEQRWGEMQLEMQGLALGLDEINLAIKRGEDPRAALRRNCQRFYTNTPTHFQSGMEYARDRIGSLVHSEVLKATGSPPPAPVNVEVFSTFNATEKAELLTAFDSIDAFPHIDAVADQYNVMEDTWLRHVAEETGQVFDESAFFSNSATVDSYFGLDPLPFPATPKIADMAAENRGWAAAWRNLQIKDVPASRSEQLRDAPTIAQVRKFFYNAASERIAKMAAEVDPSFTREVMAGDVSKPSEQLQAMRQFLVTQQRTAVQAGDAEKARDLGEILRRSTGYLVETDNTLTRLLADISAPPKTSYSAVEALEEVRRNPFYLMAMGYSRNIDLPDEITHRRAAWDGVVGALQSGNDPRADLLRRVDGYNCGLVDSIERDSYVEVAKAFDSALQEVVGEGQPLPPVIYDGRMFTAFDDAARRSLAETFDAIDGGAVVAHPDIPDDLFSVGFDDLLVLPAFKAAESPQGVDGLTSSLPSTSAISRPADDSHLDTWRNALKRAANRDNQPIVYLDTGSVATVYAGDGAGRSALDRIANPRGASQLSPQQRSIAQRFAPLSPHERMIIRRSKLNNPVDPLQDMRFLFQDPGDLVPNAAEGGMWDYRLTDLEIQRYMDEPHVNPPTRKRYGRRKRTPQGAHT